MQEPLLERKWALFDWSDSDRPLTDYPLAEITA